FPRCAIAHLWMRRLPQDSTTVIPAPSFPDVQLHIVDAPLGAGPESILPIVVMDSGLALRAPRNDEKRKKQTKQKETPCSNSSSTVPAPGPISPSTTSSRSQRNSAPRFHGGRSWSAASST